MSTWPSMYRRRGNDKTGAMGGWGCGGAVVDEINSIKCTAHRISLRSNIERVQSRGGAKHTGTSEKTTMCTKIPN